MKFKKSLVLVLSMVLSLGNFAWAKENEENTLPERPTETTVDVNKYVPRIGEKLIFYIDNFGYENKDTPIRGDYGVKFINFERFSQYSLDSMELNEVRIPKIELKKFKDGAWKNTGVEVELAAFNGNGPANIEKAFLPGNEEGFKVSKDEIIESLRILTEEMGYEIGLEDVSEYILYMNSLSDSGEIETPKADEYNYIKNYGPMEVEYNIVDKSTYSPYATLQGEANATGDKYSMYWLYYETSDIKLSLKDEDKNREFKPGDELEILVEIKNTSENIINTRLCAGLDLGEKEIVKNPTKTEGEVDLFFEYENSGTPVIKEKIQPQDSFNFVKTFKIPENLNTEYLNEQGDLVLTPFLFTASIDNTSGSNKGSYHYEEREYNEPLVLKLEKENVEVKFDANGGKYEDNTVLKTKIISSGTKIDKGNIENPKKDNYDFKGWTKTKDGNDYFDFSESINNSKTLYAKWDSIKDIDEDNDSNYGGSKRNRKDKKEIKEVKEEIIIKQQHKAYIKGYEDKTFKPEKNISREEVAVILYRLLEENNINLASEEFISFNDVEENRWSKKEIEKLQSLGVLQGYEDGSFKPEQSITRGEVSKIVTKFKNMNVNKEENSLFTDVENHWAKNYINTLSKNNLIKGYENGEFKPEQNITRAEFVTMINRVLNRKVEVVNIKNDVKVNIADFKDLNSKEWYYNDVVEASNSHTLKSKRLYENFEEWTAIN